MVSMVCSLFLLTRVMFRAFYEFAIRMDKGCWRETPNSWRTLMDGSDSIQAHILRVWRKGVSGFQYVNMKWLVRSLILLLETGWNSKNYSELMNVMVEVSLFLLKWQVGCHNVGYEERLERIPRWRCGFWEKHKRIGFSLLWGNQSYRDFEPNSWCLLELKCFV